jgi:pSer/pThr/pTyr-binding forkhead associated (FHA) protein
MNEDMKAQDFVANDMTKVGIPAVVSSFCTESQRVLSEQDREVIANLPVGSALLIALSGANVGSRFLLDVDVTVAGRHEDADILLDDSTVSRKHVEFIKREEKFFVRDIGSLNGTYVNKQRIDETELHNGDEIQIGKYHLTFYAPLPIG